MTTAAEVRYRSLANCLLEFGRSPGLYALRLREPAELFADLDTVALWALGRLPGVLEQQLGPARSTDVVAAAVLFVQRACFEPGNTHYQVLGLASDDFAPDRLRARYRALIRLTHPDMGVQGLPPNAAGMVNRANEVLSDEAARRHYDEQLAQRLTTRGRTKPAPDQGGAAGAAARGGVGPDRRGGPATAYRPGGDALSSGGRLSSLMARYPRQVRLGLVAGGAVLPLLAIAFWVAHETTFSASQMLVARAPGVDAGATPDRRAHLVKAVPAVAPAPVASTPLSSVGDSAPLPATLSHELRSSPQSAPSASTTSPNPPLPAAPARPAPSQKPMAVARSDTPARQSSGVSTTVDAVKPVVTQPPEPPPAAVPVAVWPVDAGSSRKYLDDIVATLERPAEAQRLNAYFLKMRVKGSLLRPATDAQSVATRWQVQRSAWSESQTPGVLTLRSVLVLSPSTSAAGETAGAFRLLAEFRGTREGTVLERLELVREH